jgi:hypothetical protein
LDATKRARCKVRNTSHRFDNRASKTLGDPPDHASKPVFFAGQHGFPDNIHHTAPHTLRKLSSALADPIDNVRGVCQMAGSLGLNAHQHKLHALSERGLFGCARLLPRR